MKHFLVIILGTFYLLNSAKSESSSEEESADSSEELFGTENNQANNQIRPKDQSKCTDYLKIEEVESCFGEKCKTECVAANCKIAGTSQFVPESCSRGCYNQISTFKAAKAAFPQTSADLLLGTSVDRCWDGCIEWSTKLEQDPCISGCETMRKIQKKQLRTTKEVEQTEAKPIETNESFQENLDKSKESRDDAKDDKEQFQEESGPVVRTYILWHPMDQYQAYQAYNVMFSIIQKMFQEMDGMDNMNDGKEVIGGWKDDRRQLRLPHYQPRTAAFTSPGDQAYEVYDKVVDSLDNLKNKVKAAVSRPEFKENVFYCLMAIVCYLLLTALYDNCTEDHAPGTEEDHFFKIDKSTSVKLPTYEDCIKADKYMAGDANDDKNLEDVGNMTKADLSLSFSVVLDEKDPLHK